MKAEIYTDGGARPTNPGHAGFGVLVRCGGKEQEIARYIGWKSNNEAEYIGLIVGLKTALLMGATEAVITMDSKLVIEQVEGQWACKKPHLRVLRDDAQTLVAKFEHIKWCHVRGHRGHEENERVDKICTAAILEGMETVTKVNPFTKKAGRLPKKAGNTVDAGLWSVGLTQSSGPTSP